MTHLEQSVGLDPNLFLLSKAFMENDEPEFSATMIDAEEAGYKTIHRKCGREVDLYGLCFHCGVSLL